MFEILSLILLFVACLLAMTREGWALALITAMFAFEQVLQASLPIFTQIPALGNIIIGTAAVAAAFRIVQVTPRPFEGYFTQAWICCVAICCVAALSLLWTPSFGTAWALTRWGLPYFVLFILVGPILITDRESVSKFLTAFVLLGTAITFLIVLNPQFTLFRGRLGINLDALVRSNPLAMGELAGCVMIVGALWRGTRGTAAFVVIRVIAVIAGAVLCFQSGSRGQIIFAVLITVALYPVAVRLKSVGVFLGSAIALLSVSSVLYWIVPQLLGFQEASRWDAGSLEGGVSVRFQNVLDIMTVFAVSPVAWMLGLGSNAFAGITTASSEPYSHVLFVDVLAEQGIPAFLILSWFLWVVLRDFRWLLREFRDSPRDRSSLASLFALFIYELLLVNKQGYLWASMVFFLLGVVIVRMRVRVAEGIDTQELSEYSDDVEPLEEAHPSHWLAGER